jgi:hypothetical protein
MVTNIGQGWAILLIWGLRAFKALGYTPAWYVASVDSMPIIPDFDA